MCFGQIQAPLLCLPYSSSHFSLIISCNLKKKKNLLSLLSAPYACMGVRPCAAARVWPYASEVSILEKNNFFLPQQPSVANSSSARGGPSRAPSLCTLVFQLVWGVVGLVHDVMAAVSPRVQWSVTAGRQGFAADVRSKFHNIFACSSALLLSLGRPRWHLHGPLGAGAPQLSCFPHDSQLWASVLIAACGKENLLMRVESIQIMARKTRI